MNSTEMKLKEFVENDEYYKNKLYIEDIDKVNFSISPIRIEDIGLNNLSITMDDMCLFSINDIPTKYYVLVREVIYRLTRSDYNYLDMESHILNDKDFILMKPEILSYIASTENYVKIGNYAKRYKYINEYKILEEEDLKNIFNRNISNIEWNSDEMDKIKQFLGFRIVNGHGFSSFKYKAELISLKKLKELICKLNTLEYNLVIPRMDRL